MQEKINQLQNVIMLAIQNESFRANLIDDPVAAARCHGWTLEVDQVAFLKSIFDELVRFSATPNLQKTDIEYWSVGAQSVGILTTVKCHLEGTYKCRIGFVNGNNQDTPW